jgi:glycosyltransferase involved in cell wall biosynthesis
MISLDAGVLEAGQARKRMQEYAKRVSRLSIIVYTSKGRKPVSIADNCIVYPTNSASRVLFPWNAVQLGAMINEKHPVNVIVSQDAHGTGISGVLLKKRLGIPLQVQLHGDYINNKWVAPALRVLNGIALRVVKSADSVRVVSERVEQKLLKLGISRSKIVRIPIHTDVKRFENARSKRISGSPVFLFVGRLSPEKNVSLLLHAFAGLKSVFPKSRLIIVGGGPERKRLEMLSRSLKIAEMTGFVGRADPAPYYKSAACLVLPSFNEGWGLVVIEASAAGCPVVMSDVGCAGEIIVNNKSGLVFPVNDVEKLREAMLRLGRDSKLGRRLARSARQIIKKLPSESETVKKLVASWRVIA